MIIASLLGRTRVRAVLLSAGLLIALPHQAQALPLACVSDTLTNYLALSGTGGCSIGSVVFDDFALLGLPFGSTPIPDSQVHVTPYIGVSAVNLDFSLAPTATAGPLDTLEILIGYDVHGGDVSGATLKLAGASASDDASVTALENYCVGASFSVFCPGLATAVFDPSLGVDTLSDTSGPFGSTSLLGVVTDIAVGAGITGGASLGGPVTNQFDVAPSAVPEPATLLLVAGGLAVARLRSKRPRRRV